MSQLGLTNDQRAAASRILNASERLAFYGGVLRDAVPAALIDALAAAVQGHESSESLRYRFLAAVAQGATPAFGLLSATRGLSAWQQLMMSRVLFDENPFTEAAERLGDRVPQGMITLAAHDLRVLQKVYEAPQLLASWLDPQGILPSLALDESPQAWAHDPLDQLHKPMVHELSAASDWGESVSSLARWLNRVGAGVFGKYIAFRWDPSHKVSLVPIRRPDLVSPDSLYEYEKERAAVFRNTEKFIQGLPAQNVLLYGDRGTGKSATVKATLCAFAARGLRMIEVPRTALGSIPDILQLVQGRGVRVILFVDDLSFEEGDVAYKQLKAVLEGTLEGRPQNVLIYATSNRRHLVKQHFSDRSSAADDDVNPRDTLEEKLSLSDRFGMTVIFPSPDQSRYLEIVRGIADQRGIKVPEEELQHRALQWAMWNNGRSPRTAQRFIDHLESEQLYRPVHA